MKIFKLMAIALVAMVGLNSCSKDCDHDFIEVDYSKDIVGTWTILEPDHSAAYIFNADGTVSSTGVDSNGAWSDVKGTYSIVNNKITMNFESAYDIEGSFDIIPGHTFSFVDKTGRHTYNYCKKDLSNELLGMWVCADGFTAAENDMNIMTFGKDGIARFSGWASHQGEFLLNDEGEYKVVGDLLFQKISDKNPTEGYSSYLAVRLMYVPNGNAYGDMMYKKAYLLNGGKVEEYVTAWLRVNQSLDLSGKKYDHIKTFVSNVKGEDKDINFMGYTMNLAKMDGSGLDKMLKAILFNVEFPTANKLNYSYQMNGNKETFDANIVVEGNKMTIKMSEKVPTLKDVVLYAFQDADCSQLHFYMDKTAFVNFYTNMQAMLMEATNEQFDINNAEAVNAIYNEINNAVETINVSLVMSK